MGSPVSTRQHAGVLVITIDSPPVNALSDDVLRGLGAALDSAAGDADVRAVVVTGASGVFVAGADITRLGRIARGESAPGADASVPPLADLIARLESGPWPSVAAIDGFALGGGLELALGCNARVATAQARVGLPELQLGLIPGAGGTQRLPRLIGVEPAATLMIDGTQLRAPEAARLGVLDEVVPDASTLVERAIAVAREMLDGTRARRATLRFEERIEGGERATAIGATLRANTAKKRRNVGYYDACLDAIVAGAAHGPDAGLARESELFAEVLASPAARGLIHLFFAERAVHKVAGVTDRGLTARSIERVGVVGGGTMGSGIATALIQNGVQVHLQEASPELAGAARVRVVKNVERDVEKGRVTRERADEQLARLTTTHEWSGFGEVDLAIEAATEQVELKQRLFARLAEITHPGCLLATNTSTIDLELVGAGLADRRRLLGLHFFSPAHVMKLVEVVRTAQTAPEALADALALCKRIKKTPVVVGNCVGFLVNRVFMPYGQVNGLLIDRGVDPYRIDRVQQDWGMPMGPNRMSDLAGIDVGVAAGAILAAAYPGRGYRSALRPLLAEAGRLGEKTSAGHYRYEGGQAVEDPLLADFVREARARAGNPAAITVSDQDIVEWMHLAVVNECCRALDEGVALRAGDVDVAITLGMGYPRYRGGPMRWASELGAARAVAQLNRAHDLFGLELFVPSPRLVEAARGGSALDA